MLTFLYSFCCKVFGLQANKIVLTSTMAVDVIVFCVLGTIIVKEI